MSFNIPIYPFGNPINSLVDPVAVQAVKDSGVGGTLRSLDNKLPDLIPLDGLLVSAIAYYTAPPGQEFRNTAIVAATHGIIHTLVNSPDKILPGQLQGVKSFLRNVENRAGASVDGLALSAEMVLLNDSSNNMRSAAMMLIGHKLVHNEIVN